MTRSADAHLFEQIAESLRLQIARGELQPGDRLPSIRELADTWGCTPGTVNRAYAMLADEGLTTSHRGSGTVVSQGAMFSERKPLRSAVLTNQVEALLLNLLGQGYTETEIEKALTESLHRWQAWQQKSAIDQPRELSNQLRFAGSHDLAVALLAEELHGDGIQLKTDFRGSLGGLIAIARGEADLAGSHLWDEEGDCYNAPFVQRILPGMRVALLTVAARSFGLLLPAGNPQAITGLKDLVKPGVRWINRQPGSGTRVWLDAQLKRHGIAESAITGYQMTKTTHHEVAETIQSGQATAGLGIEAAAIAHQLDFVPVAQEVYQLVIPEAVFNSHPCQKLVQLLRSERIKEMFQDLGGYDVTQTGEITWF